MPRHLLLSVLAVTLMTPACGKSDPKPAPPTAPPVSTVAADTTQPPAAVVSPLAAAKKALEAGAAIASPAAVKDALAQAETLAKWAAENPEHADATGALLLSARTTALTVAAASTGTPEMAKALGPDDAATRHLRQTLTRIEPLKSDGPTGQDTDRLRLAVRALLATTGGSDAPLDAKALAQVATLAKADPALGKAVGDAWTKTLIGASAYGEDVPTHGRVASFAKRAGGLLCPGCAKMGDVDPAGVEALLKNAENATLLGCAAAAKAAATASTPGDVAKAYAACPSFAAAKLEPSALAGSNALFVAGLQRIAALGGNVVADAQLPLPSPALTTTNVSEGDTTPGVIEGLGLDGMNAAPAAEIWVIGSDGVRGGLRPTVAVRDGKLVSVAAKAGVTVDDAAVISLEALATAEPDKDSGAIAAIATRATALGAAAGVKPDDAETKRIAELVVDRDVPASAVVRTLGSLGAAGYDAFRFTKTATVDSTLPLVVQKTPENLPEGVVVGFGRPILIHIGSDAVDVWGPDAPATPAPAGAPSTKLPSNLRPSYRGKTLVRLRAPIPGADAKGLSASTLAHIVNAVTYWRMASGAGPVIHVAASPEVRAADVLRASRAIQEASGDTMKDIASVWPGASCAGDPSLAGCATAIAVGFSSLAEPSTRGLTDKPVERKTPTKPKPKPPASDEFCNKRDIKVQMRKKAGDFRFCYERQLQLLKNLEGRVTTSFVIGLSGAVSGARVTSSTLKNKKVHACLLKRISKIKFAKPDGGQCAVRWPFKFKQN